jgi:hypothetical protein
LKLSEKEKKLQSGMQLRLYHFKGARNKRDIALKAEAEAAMEKLAAGFENRKWFALPIHSKRR